MPDKVSKTPEQWRRQLSAQAYAVCREGATERPFTGQYWNSKSDGVYCCTCCGAALFDSRAKYDSGSGWPSFSAPAQAANLARRSDDSHGMQRTEVLCAACDAHLGHVFPDGPPPAGERYCINSVALRLVPRG